MPPVFAAAGDPDVPYGLFILIASAEAVAICALAGVVVKLALRGVDREVAAAVAEERCAKAMEQNTHALELVREFLKE